MRDLTKSVTSYTWAMSVFWTQQLFSLAGLGGSGSWDRSRKSFNALTDATSNELGNTMRAVFRTGDTIQRGVVDLFLAPFSLWNAGGGGSARRDSIRDGGRDTNGRDMNGRDMDDGRSWADAAARVTQAGADVFQEAVDTTARTTGRAAESFTGDRGQRGAPPSHDPSVGWGPMPR